MVVLLLNLLILNLTSDTNICIVYNNIIKIDTDQQEIEF